MEPYHVQPLLPELTLTSSPTTSLQSSISEDEEIRPLLSPIVSEPDNLLNIPHNRTTLGDDENDFLLRSLKSYSFSNANLRLNSKLSLNSSKSSMKRYTDNPNDKQSDAHAFIFDLNNSRVFNSTVNLHPNSNITTDIDNMPISNNSSRRNSIIPESIATSILELKDLTIEQIKRRRFFVISIFSIICIFIFDLIFLPRTSLDRDLRRLYGGFLTYDDVSRIFLSQLNYNNNVENYLNLYDNELHKPGGENYYLAEKLMESFTYLDTYTEIYDVYMGTPIDTNLLLLDENDEIIYKPNINESNQLSYFPYSANATITSEFVYVNYGFENDYNLLISNSINLENKIFIIRIDYLHPSLLIEKAQNHGAIGVIFYKDPYDDGEITENNGYKNFPDGYARNHYAIDKFTGNFIYYQPGDPTTPGWSPYIFGDYKRLKNPNTIPKIPILPISFTEIQPILNKISNKGPNLNWTGNILDFDYKPGPSNKFKISMTNKIDYNIKPIHNIIATIPGIISDEEIIIGSSRDVISGYGGISKGEAGIFEIARGFNELRKRNWKPLRSIKLILWDGSSLGQLGSTEFGEYHSQKLINDCIVYINFDDIRGSQLFVESNPMFKKLIKKIMKLIMIDSHETLEDNFKFNNGTIGLISKSVKDYAVFQNHLGIPSINIGMKENKEIDPISYYNSKFDNMELLKSYDSDLKFHNLVAQFIGMLTIDLSEREILDIQLSDYIGLIKVELANIFNELPKGWLNKKMNYPFENTILNDMVSSVKNTTVEIFKLAEIFDNDLKNLQNMIIQDYPWFKLFKKIQTAIKIKLFNIKIKSIDRIFISSNIYGVDQKNDREKNLITNRNWFRHLIFAPSVESPTVSVFPGLREAIKNENYEQFELNLISLQVALDRIYVGL